jgi:hypothetical protein
MMRQAESISTPQTIELSKKTAGNLHLQHSSSEVQGPSLVGEGYSGLLCSTPSVN